jgi:magnesium-protoporphyrin IX monomethyl ester (oxidative) cyclase
MANRKESKPALPPYGLACIAGVLREHGHSVQIYDMLTEGYYKEQLYPNGMFIRYGANQKDLNKVLDRFNPDFVGISAMMSLRHFESCDVVKWIKEYDPQIITVVGGNHATAMPRLVYNDCQGKLDYIVGGEGEYSMLSIVNRECNGPLVSQFSHTNLFNLSMAAHDLLHLDLYERIWKDTQYHFYEINGKYITTSTSRGCVNSCHHCPHELVFGRGWRPRPVDDIIKEVDWVTSKLGVKEIQFHEYNGQVNKKFMLEIAKRMKPFQVRWGYPIGMWIKLLDKPMLEAMYDSGMDYINLAIESENPNVLGTMPGKDVDLNYVHQVIKWCNDIGYYINGFFMLGFPDQTIADMEKTVDYAISLDINTAAFFIAQPLPGTPMWDKVEFAENFHPMHLRYGKCNIKSKLWTAEQVEQVRHEGRKKFLASRGGKTRGGNFSVQ